MKKKLLLSLVLSIALQLTAFSPSGAQEKIKFGKIALEELEMTHYGLDTSAHAVILYDKGHLHSNTGIFTRHLRLKVLSSAGTAHANFQVRTSARSDIQGSTYNLVNGQIEETPLQKENIFKEEVVEGFYVYKIFFPSVRPGSVVELKYSFTGLPYEWRFQERIPIKYNQLVLEPTRAVVFKKTMFGNHPINNDGDTWTATDVPAFLEEPFMCHYTNYLTHFKIDMESVMTMNRSYLELSTSWEKIAERLREARAFGGVLNNSPFLNEKAHEIKNTGHPQLKKIQACYKYIQENIKWNGWSTEFVTQQFWENFKKNHSGNSAEVNLLLVAILQKAGIKTYPVVMSTRDNGMLNPLSASLNGLNYVIAYVKTDSLELLLDATEPELVPGMLPTRCRNVSAYVIDTSGGGWWIDISDGKADTRKQFVSVEQDDSGRMIAKVSNTHEDYDYLKWITEYKDKGTDEAYIRSVITNTTDLNISACQISIDQANMKAFETRTVDLTDTEYFQDLGNEALINPFVFCDISNPFKQEERRYPVDFVYPRNRSVIVSFNIPKDYTLRKVPEQYSIAPENGGAKFTFMSSLNNNLLTIRCTLKIEKQIYTQDEYAPLRQFFIAINRKISEPIQIDKKI